MHALGGGGGGSLNQDPARLPLAWLLDGVLSFVQVFSPVNPLRQVTGEVPSHRGGENPTFVSGKQRFIKKQAEANWKGKLAML